MLTFEELAVALSIPDRGITKKDLVSSSLGMHKSERFDKQVALATIDKLIGIDYISRDRSGNLSLTYKGHEAVFRTKTGSILLFRKLVYG